MSLVVSIIVITTAGSTQYEESRQWNTTGNDTDDVSIGAIGRFAPIRRRYGYDQNGKVREKW